ncbi:hypothetical protein AERO9AM_50017 [Aeromicrobium sp. 9AM]|nr:hypothetical protein AERO9AM_50017 [Aeromicrobium sp. 9AM]
MRWRKWEPVDYGMAGFVLTMASIALLRNGAVILASIAALGTLYCGAVLAIAKGAQTADRRHR